MEEGKEHNGILYKFVEAQNTEEGLPLGRTDAQNHYLGSKINSEHRIKTQIMYHTDD